jgi:2,5-diketo-D-gluconate reductase B
LFPLDLDLDAALRADYQTADPPSHYPFIDDADRKAIAALPKDKRFVNPDFAPDWD